jgi:hypothetical protein
MDFEPAVQRSEPVGQAAQTGPRGRVRAADSIIAHLHDSATTK